MADREIRISLLGHKDHGKSTLIGRMLHDTGSITEDRINEALATSRSLGRDGLDYAFLLDSFEEEREGGFTLDTTRAQVRHKGTIFELIDVPGHRELVRNMLSGASTAQAAILIVSAKEGEGLQDETHLHICLASLLGIKRMVVAVNKMDAAGYSERRFYAVKSQVALALQSFGLNPLGTHFVPVSAVIGDNIMERSANMPWYTEGTLVSHLERFSEEAAGESPEALPLRIFVQDSYGKIAVGRIEAGSVSTGDRLALEPAGKLASVKALYSGSRLVASARAGQNVGIEFEPDTDAPRGTVCSPAGKPCTGKISIAARVFCLGKCLFAGDKLKITCSTQDGVATVGRISERSNPAGIPGPAGGGSGPQNTEGKMQTGETAIIELRFDRPLVFESFSAMPYTGRFILSNDAGVAAAGIVL